MPEGRRLALPMMTCEGCGVCCTEQGLPPGYVIPELMFWMPEEL
ncbi:MAG TPA: hypothetical protein VGI99_09540 [Gemmataceae bacterium]